MKKKLLIISLIVILTGLLGCAFMQANSTGPIKTVALTELAFQGNPVEVLVPEECGDFSIFGISDAVLVSEEVIALIFEDVESYRAFILLMKTKCPETVGLIMGADEGKNSHYWIYQDSKNPTATDEITFQEFLEKDHPCLISLVPGIEV